VASIFDFHAQAAISYYWRNVYGPNLEAFKALFERDFEEGLLDEPLVESWHEALLGVTEESPMPSLEHLGIGVSYSSGIDRMPWVGVELNDEPPSEGFLGNLVDIVDGVELEGGMIDQSVSLHCFGSPQVAVALHVLVRAIMYRAAIRFLRIGYENVVYNGAQDLVPDEKLIEEYGGIMQRRQRWRGMGVVQVPAAAISHKEVRVHAIDTIIEGEPGGAAPWLEEE
jgi:hypothetical protein